MKMGLILLIIGLELALPGRASSLDLAALPNAVRGDYRAGPYITAAALLQKMGHEAACQTLQQLARNHSDPQESELQGEKIIVLCRMLFTQRGDSEFRRPMLGGPVFFGASLLADDKAQHSNWSLEPIELVDGVPFIIVTGYVVGGFPESAAAYLSYCMANCDWNKFRFREPTASQKEKALAKLLASKKWKRELTSNEKEFLAHQIE